MDANTPQEFQQLIQRAPKSLVDFHAQWCGPCKAIAPYVHQRCHQLGINLIKVDVDRNPYTMQQYRVQSMPTFCVVDNSGRQLFVTVGGSQQNVEQALAYCR